MSQPQPRAAAGDVFLVVPVKPQVGSKQRLSAELPAAMRGAVSLAMASRTLRCVAQTWPPGQVVVVGQDPQTDALCARLGIATLADPGAGQTAAVRIGARWALERGAVTLATVSADLPRVQSADLDQVLRLAQAAGPSSLILFPDREGTGTNGMVLRPADAEVFSFGADSNRRHHRIAAELGLSCRDQLIAGLAWDVDRPQDLESAAEDGAVATHPLLRSAEEVALEGRRQRGLGGAYGKGD